MYNKNSETKADKKNAITTGVFFIAATVSAIIGLKLYDPILNNPDFLIIGVKNSSQIVLGAIFESILACTAVGTAIMMFPYLRKFNESWGLGYVCFRLLEVIFILEFLYSDFQCFTFFCFKICQTRTYDKSII